MKNKKQVIYIVLLTLIILLLFIIFFTVLILLEITKESNFSGALFLKRSVIMAAISISLFVIESVVAYLIFVKFNYSKDFEKYSDMYESIYQNTFEICLDDGIINFNDEIKTLIGASKNHLLVEDLYKENYILKKEYRQVLAAYKTLRETKKIFSTLYLIKTQKYLKITIYSGTRSNSAITKLVGYAEDVTIMKRQLLDLERKTQTDHLTQLLNRETMISNIEKTLEINKAKLHALILIDIDGFKQINDTYGHYVGDLLLQKTAQALQKLAVANNILLARFGGDEFCVFIKNLNNNQEIIDFAEIMTQKMSAITISDNIDYYVTCSIGIALYPRDGNHFIELYQGADNALYQSKEVIGTKYTLFSTIDLKSKISKIKAIDCNNSINELFDAMIEQVEHNSEALAEILTEAINNNEFVLYQQAKVSTKKVDVVESEVLARWYSPKYGIIMPNRFLPLFEKAELLNKLDIYLLEQAVKQLVEIYKENPGQVSPMAVNQSLSTICSPYYINKVTELLGKYDLPNRFLIIEITERGLFSNLRSVSKVSKYFQSIGIRVSMDDFGSGFTTLSILKSLEINEIKIDKSFFDMNDQNSEKTKIILKQICEMGQSLGITVVAKGVESREQVNYLIEYGCDFLQGFYFGESMAFKDFYSQKDKIINKIKKMYK